MAVLGEKPMAVDTITPLLRFDHCADDVRYLCMSRPWVRRIEVERKKKRDWLEFEVEDEESWRTA